ncbi:MAG: hypothetical protein ABI193_21830 [Minicystis sp.]
MKRALASLASLAIGALLTGCAAALPAPRAAVAPVEEQTVAPEEGSEPAPAESDLAALEQHLFEFRRVASPGWSVSPEEFHAESLPVITVPEPLAPLTAAVAVTGTDTGELLFDSKPEGPIAPGKHADVAVSVRVSMRDRVFGRMSIGYGSAPVNSGVAVKCGGPGGARAVLPMRWETVAPTGKGGLEYEVVNAWFDTVACKARVVERVSVLAVPVLGRVLYAFRLRPRDSGQPDLVALVGPRFNHVVSAAVGGEASNQTGNFARVTLPLRKGAGASMFGRISASTLSDWEATMGPTGFPAGEMRLGVELVQGVEDSTPIGIAFSSLPPNLATPQTAISKIFDVIDPPHP